MVPTYGHNRHPPSLWVQRVDIGRGGNKVMFEHEETIDGFMDPGGTKRMA